MTALDTALENVTGEHAAILKWFAENEGSVGPRPWREDGRSIVPGVTVPVVAQRGIHVPSKWAYAVSVTATSHSNYGDGKPVDQGDGTWVLLYNAHRGGEGQGAGSRWNRALMVCCEHRIPVGVFLPAGREYLNLGLAMIDAYYEEADTFELHGPVRRELSSELFDFSKEPETDSWPQAAWELQVREEGPALEPDERRRVQRELVRRERQDVFRRSMLSLYVVCAMTKYEAPQTLEAAHILRYRGTSSHNPANGLLLRADVHRLFDQHQLAVDPETAKIRVGRELEKTKYVELDGQRLHLPRSSEDWPSKQRLAMHFEVFSEIN